MEERKQVLVDVDVLAKIADMQQVLLENDKQSLEYMKETSDARVEVLSASQNIKASKIYSLTALAISVATAIVHAILFIANNAG